MKLIMTSKLRPYWLLSVLFLALFLSMPAAAQQQDQELETENDPWEGFNRAIFRFNDKVDKAVLKPIAQGYRAVTPKFVDTGVTNFFGNLSDVVTVANDLLQFKIEQAAFDSGRVIMNSTFGIGGLFDVATPLGLPKHEEDFGQTLGVWGVGEGYYLVLPLLGPSSTRDVWSYPVDYAFNPLSYLDPATDRWIMRGFDIVDTRADLIPAEETLEEAALDPYSFQREAYLQRRQSLVYDGDPPRPSFDDFENGDFFEDTEPDATQ